MTVNQVYSQSEARENGVSLKEWIDPLKKQYELKCSNPDKNPNMSFNEWVEKKLEYDKMQEEKQFKESESKKKEFMNADNKPKKETAAQIEQGKAAQEARRAEALKEKTIFGMKPVVFYAVSGATLIAIGVGVYFLIQKFKNKQQ